ncbi:RecX family transcriptional regulator [Roseococcus pinisoli]|uniref:Regulatory protein RecX n=1 Tax=Roseococcus pinisoli TaxID=2835040 RepID=A0ABS5QAK6_9PROT|nr:RecX family transcriptional regulator [Roseococcus pinisoli]MBS7810732.1 RecX family transcriptional regulator [Roseococcus pinisoli]
MPKITESALHQAALAHLARFASTEAGLRRVLGNRIRRWAREAEEAGQDTEAVAAETAEAMARAAAIAARLAQAGAVDDAGFARARARRLMGGGRSARATLAHLAAKGVDGETARAAMDQEDVPDELTAAVVLCRKRRIGPFGPPEPEAETRRKWLGTLARAGFAGDVAHRALRLPREAAEELLAARP